MCAQKTTTTTTTTTDTTDTTDTTPTTGENMRGASPTDRDQTPGSAGDR